jgi:hypothetical protein
MSPYRTNPWCIYVESTGESSRTHPKVPPLGAEVVGGCLVAGVQALTSLPGFPPLPGASCPESLLSCAILLDIVSLRSGLRESDTSTWVSLTKVARMVSLRLRLKKIKKRSGATPVGGCKDGC